VPVEQYPGSLETTAGKGMPLKHCFTASHNNYKFTAEKASDKKISIR